MNKDITYVTDYFSIKIIDEYISIIVKCICFTGGTQNILMYKSLLNLIQYMIAKKGYSHE
jgi:hypothetical protein